MKIKLRHEKIVEVVRKKGQTSIEELASLLDISRETVRRDLTDLTKLGKVQKVHGGAILPRKFGDGPFQLRMSRNADAKLRIADAAASLFKQGETLFIVTGSTTLYFSEKLSEISGLTVVTNSAEISKAVHSPTTTNKIFLLGGEYNADNRQTIGTMVITQIRAFRAHHTVLTIGALDAINGAMDYSIEEAQIASTMIERSQSLTILADSSKFDELASFEVCSLEQINRLVCDKPPPKALREALLDAGAEIIVAR
jgi:DeoR family glycerol-3-phosphate regulon repressor